MYVVHVGDIYCLHKCEQYYEALGAPLDQATFFFSHSSAAHYLLMFSLLMLSLLSVSSFVVVPVLSDLHGTVFFLHIHNLDLIHVSNVVIRRCVGKLVLVDENVEFVTSG